VTCSLRRGSTRERLDPDAGQARETLRDLKSIGFNGVLTDQSR